MFLLLQIGNIMQFFHVLCTLCGHASPSGPAGTAVQMRVEMHREVQGQQGSKATAWGAFWVPQERKGCFSRQSSSEGSVSQLG